MLQNIWFSKKVLLSQLVTFTDKVIHRGALLLKIKKKMLWEGTVSEMSVAEWFDEWF